MKITDYLLREKGDQVRVHKSTGKKVVVKTISISMQFLHLYPTFPQINKSMYIKRTW
jgi:hypothetical protein